MYNLGYSSGTVRSLYEINKTSNIAVDTPVGKTSSITVEEVVKQGTQLCPIISMVKWKSACQSLWII